MTDKIKNSFDKIQMEQELKEATLKRIYDKQEDVDKRGFFQRLKIKQVVTVLACAVPMFFIGFFSYNTYTNYFTESAYVDLDINPSIELSVNKYNRVIEASAYNEDGEDLLKDLDIKNEKIQEALPEIIDATAEEGQLQKEGLVSVTVQANSKKEKELLALIKSIVEDTLKNYDDTKTDIFAVSHEVKTTSHDMHLTPAKYLAICELQKVDPTATVDECRHNSIGGIKKRTKEHEGKHKNSSGSGSHDSGSSSSGSSGGSGHNSKTNNHSSGSGSSGSSSNTTSNHSSSSGSSSGSGSGSTHHEEEKSHNDGHE